jgi:hypothetical protein
MDFGVLVFADDRLHNPSVLSLREHVDNPR